MSDYIQQLEDQNEQLRRKLAETEVERDNYKIMQPHWIQTANRLDHYQYVLGIVIIGWIHTISPVTYEINLSSRQEALPWAFTGSLEGAKQFAEKKIMEDFGDF